MVVAIIAVLVAIAIPVFGASLARSRAAVCMANRRSLQGELTYTGMLGSSADVKAAYDADKDQYVCPEGGVLSYELNKNGSVTVFCSKHYANIGPTLFSALQEAVKNATAGSWMKAFLTSKGKSVDSTASYAPSVTTTPNRDLVLAELKKAGVNLDALGAKSWSVVNPKDAVGKVQVLWSDQDISKLAVADGKTQVRVLCYDTSTDTYRVGYAEVTSDKLGNNNYNVMSESAKANGFTGEATFGSYADAYKAFGELEETRQTPTTP